MLIPHFGRQVTQVGLVRPCLLPHFQPLLRQTLHSGFRRTIQNSTFSTGAGQRLGRAASTKRAFGVVAVASLGFGFSAFTRSKVFCEAPPLGTPSTQDKEPCGPISTNEYPPPPQSSLSLFELSFGAAAGICSGVFVKKGARAVAWFLGGMFVFLQYLGSKSLVKVDWARMSSRFENLFYTRDALGHPKPPNVLSLWKWLVDFLTADFQPRASFIAGFALGLRVG
ncbi:hypothetical protein D9756_001655 [Leucocoprinus leucothites]|uniref:FUN14 family-domain-containing protein n=1 Tax=Leucocoprinus leucothites TaxID=201217 RepID=A0A8H5G3X1_9AGAR|nr:hypothetical protein D9756_001655 [Leucoagaricus leucothites]